jgi:hypothetical protein
MKEHVPEANRDRFKLAVAWPVVITGTESIERCEGDRCTEWNSRGPRMPGNARLIFINVTLDRLDSSSHRVQ